MADKNTIWTIILIVSVILIINGVSDVGDKDKKVAQAGQNTATLGAVGLVATTFKKGVWFLGLTPAILRVIAWPVAALVAFFPSIIGRFVDIFRPSPTIPGFVWIGAFVVIIFMLMSRKK